MKKCDMMLPVRNIRKGEIWLKKESLDGDR